MGWRRRTGWLIAAAVVVVVVLVVLGDRGVGPSHQVVSPELRPDELELLLRDALARERPTSAVPAPDVPRPIPGTTYGDPLRRQPRTERELRDQLASLGFPATRSDEVVALAEPALVLARRDGPAGIVPGGVSQVGGLPLLPPGEPWPTVGGRQLSLVAQIDLDAVGGMLAERFPDRGVLQFWLDLEFAEGPPLPPDPAVRWWPDKAVLEQRVDGHAGWGATPIRVDFEPVLSVPLCGERVFRYWPPDERDRYCELPEPRVIDQLGGWPFEFQGDPTASIALRAAGLTFEQVAPPDPFPDAGTDAEKRAWLAHADDRIAAATEVDDWRLALQLEMTPGDHMWADGGNVWFMGRADDLASGSFDDIRGELASH